MSATTLHESKLDPAKAYFRKVIRAGDHYVGTMQHGETLRIVDLEGNQAVDTLFYNADRSEERYSAQATIVRQGGIYLSAGTELISSEGRVMLRIVADTCGRHDTLGGACAAESNMVRYALEKKFMHNCRDSFLLGLANSGYAMDKRDLTANINFFMNVPVTAEGRLTFDDGVSAAGRYVEMQAEMNILILISNCPQLNNPCNAYNPTPAEILLWR